MYLSKLLLNPRSKAARRDEANPYEMHSSLCWAFRKPEASRPEGESWERGKTVYPFLWRFEPPQPRATPAVLVQSETEPQWDTFTERNADYFSQVETKRLPLEHLTKGQTLRFRLRANPTVTKRHDDHPDKQKRVGLYRPEGLLGYTDDKGVWVPGWLERQGTKGGFVPLDFDATEVERLRFFKHKGGNPITLQSALFDGYLRITDLERFKQTLANGVGKAKALGFGLLSVAKA